MHSEAIQLLSDRLQPTVFGTSFSTPPLSLNLTSENLPKILTMCKPCPRTPVNHVSGLNTPSPKGETDPPPTPKGEAENPPIPKGETENLQIRKGETESPPFAKGGLGGFDLSGHSLFSRGQEAKNLEGLRNTRRWLMAKMGLSQHYREGTTPYFVPVAPG